MPRPGPRRPLLAVKAAQEDIDALDALAEKAGVSRSDVVRVGLDAVLRGIPEETLLAYLAAAREEGEPPASTREWWARLRTSQAAVGELSRRTAEQINADRQP